MTYKLFLFNCYGGCATGVAASKACIKIWEENPEVVKIGCLPAIRIPWKFKEIMKNSEKRLLVDACSVQCGKKLFQDEEMMADSYIELTSDLDIKKEKKLPSKDLEERVYELIQREVKKLLDENNED
jgi:uncharacterized metal-binding protein